MHHFKVKEKTLTWTKKTHNPTEVKDQTTQNPNQTHAIMRSLKNQVNQKILQTFITKKTRKQNPIHPKKEKQNGSQNLTSNLDKGVPIWFLSGVSMSRERRRSSTYLSLQLLLLLFFLSPSLSLSTTFYDFPSLSMTLFLSLYKWGQA